MDTHQKLQETNGDPKDQQKARTYGMSLSNEVNMTNCHEHCKHFFERCKSIHFNVLIAYWMMAGYLGPIDSIEAAYKKGHTMLLDLTYDKGRRMLEPAEKPEMIKIRASTDSEPLTCICSRHKGLCILENLGFVDLVDLDALEDFVVLADGMLKSVPKMIEDESLSSDGVTAKGKPEGSVLLLDGNHLSRQVFHPPKKLRQLAYFKPRPKSLDPLLTRVSKLLSVLLLRDCELLQEIDIPLKFEKLTVLEISGLSHVTTTEILLDRISKLSKLQCLHLSDLLIKELPSTFFAKLEQLRWLILRGCSELVSLPSVRGLKYLKMLDLSHCSALIKIATAVLQNPHLQMLDFSYTSMTNIPTIKESPNLTHLIARNVKVSVLSSLRQVSGLEVLDLSGAQKVKQISQLEGNTSLKVLDLSRTEITSIPFLPKLVHLHDLILRQCDILTQLPAVKTLTMLEVFDISGCKSLKELPEGLSDLKSLKELNLSLTSVSLTNLSFANLTNLLKLSLKGLKLASLESLASLLTLEELDLSSIQIIPPQQLKFDFLQFFVNLQILDLSNTLVAQLPDMSKLVNLRELLLANCQHLEVVPNLEPLTNLETVDLSLPESSTFNKGQGESENKVPSSCRKLVLKNRSGVQGLFPHTTPGELGHLDLRGTDVERIPYEKMAELNCIQLPAKIGLSGVCLSKSGALREVINWKDEKRGHLQGKFSNDLEIEIISTTGNKSSMSAGGDNQFFHLCEESWEAFIHLFPVSLPPKGGRDETIYLDGDEFILRNNLSWARRLLNLELQGKSVEIHGFSKVPNDFQNAENSDAEHVDAEKSAEIHSISKVPKGFHNMLQKAENVAFVGNDFLESLSDICSKPMKVCCIRRCQNMISVLSGKKIEKCPERLVLSDLVKLELIYKYDEEVSSNSIESLKHLYIDSCPKLENVASPVPGNLETLHVKFCDKLKNLFEAEQDISLDHPSTIKKISLDHLQKLIVFELPKLEDIEADLPKLQVLNISQCPKLKNLDRVIESASASLTQLCLDSCPGLKHALPSLPELKKLEELKISSCNEIVTLFANTGSSSSSSSKKHSLLTLRLRNLPKLESIGAELSLTSAPDLDPYLPASVRQQLSFPAQP